MVQLNDEAFTVITRSELKSVSHDTNTEPLPGYEPELTPYSLMKTHCGCNESNTEPINVSDIKSWCGFLQPSITVTLSVGEWQTGAFFMMDLMDAGRIQFTANYPRLTAHSTPPPRRTLTLLNKPKERQAFN